MRECFQADIRRQLQQSGNATTYYHKGRALEDLMCCLFEAIPGITATRNKKNVFETEEVDICVYNVFSPGGLPSPAFPPWILIECKNWSQKVSSSEVSWFDTKLRDRGLSLGILIATQGITGDSQRLTDAHFIVAKALSEQRKIIVITREDIEGLTSGSDLVVLLIDKLSNLYLNMTCF
jgi:hypothetical protein